MFICAQKRDPDRQDYTVRVKSKELGQLLERGVKIGMRLVAGSKPPASGAIWQHWESAGYNVKVCSRDVDTGKEDLVDDFILSQAQNCVMSRSRERSGENTLVICTGDGNSNKGYTSFLNVVRNSAAAGWRVEVWSWSWSCSRNYREVAREFPSRVSIIELDPYFDQITFQAKTPKNTTKSAVAAPASVSVGAPPPSVGGDNEGSPREADDDAELCIICMDNERTHILLPCCHYTHCRECAATVGSSCPVCRTDITEVREVFST